MKTSFDTPAVLEDLLLGPVPSISGIAQNHDSFAKHADFVLPENADVTFAADGTMIVLIDGVEVPMSALEGEIVELASEAAAEEVTSAVLSGGGSAQPFNLGTIGPGIDQTDLLPPTALAFAEPTQEELETFVDDNDMPGVDVVVDDPADPTTGDPVDPSGAVDPVTGLTIFELGETVVSEEGLPGGDEHGMGSNMTSGDFEVDTGSDELSSLQVGGVDVTAGGVVEGEFGDLTVSVSAAGDYSWVYVLAERVDHPDAGPFGTSEGITEDFVVIVTDDDGDQASDSLVIGIIDDGPVAIDDMATISEDGPFVLTGSVMPNDSPGADAALVTSLEVGDNTYQPGEAIETEYGTLTVEDDGGYTFVLDRENPDIEFLTAGEELEDIATYTLTDSDGDPDEAVLTIVITGQDDGVQIFGLSGNVPEVSVDEDDLPEGQSPDAAELTRTDSFEVDAPDGVETVSIGGIDLVTGGVFAGGPVSVPTDNGTLIITGFTPQVTRDGALIGGTFEYEFTLTTSTTDHGPEDNGENDLIENVLVTLTDRDGDSVSDELGILITDDVPDASDEIVAQEQENADILIDLTDNIIPGADGVDLETAVISLNLTGEGDLTYNQDGTFTYSPSEGETGVVTFDYLVTDDDGDTATATVTLTLADDSAPVISINGGDFVDEAGLPGGTSSGDGSITTSGTFNIISGDDTLALLEIDGADITGGGQVTGDYGVLTVVLSGGVYSWSYTLSTAIDHPDNPNFGTAEGQFDSFDVSVTDSDGDAATAQLTIDILDDGPVARDDGTVEVTEGSDEIFGNLAANDDFGADGSSVSSFMYDGQVYGPGDSVVTDSGAVFSVTSDGAYSYTPADNVTGPVTEEFSYTLTDGDSDRDAATISFVYTGDIGMPVINPVFVVLDEDDISGGNGDMADGDADVSGQSGFIAVDFGLDGPGAISFTGGGDTVTVGGEDYDISVSADGLVLTLNDGTNDVLRLELADPTSGAYTATLLQNLTHEGTDPGFEDDLVFTLGYTVTDSDGSVVSSQFNVTVDDDIPVLAPIEVSSPAENESVIIDVGAQLSEGADGVDLINDVRAEVAVGEGQLSYDDMGVFTYTPQDGEAGPVTILVSVTDGDGDVASLETTFTLPPDSEPTLTIVGDNQVDEAGLPGGTNDGDGSDFTTGQFSIDSGNDTIASILVNGEDPAAGPITGTYGVLTAVFDSAAGQVNWTYTLTGPLAHPDDTGFGTAEGIFDSFNVEVIDSDGSTASGTLNIDILDDGPVARDDFAELSEGGPYSVSDNLITSNDTVGADGAEISALEFGGAQAVGVSFATEYGDIIINADGEYTYEIDTADAETLALIESLGENEVLTEVIQYTLQDGDDDVSVATLTITITGQDDGVSITGLNGDAIDVVVDEEHLADGSNPTPASLTQSESFDIAAADGVADVTLGTTALIVGGVYQGDGVTVETDLGVVTITGFTPESTSDGTLIGGTFTYTYLLETNGVHPLADGQNDLFETLTLTLTDVDGDTASDNLNIQIIDDIPDAQDDGAVMIIEGGGPYTGDVLMNDVEGADSAVVALDSPPTSAFGTLILNADGTYEYAPSGSVPSGTVDSFTYTLTDTDGDVDTAVLSFTYEGDANIPLATGASASADEDDLDIIGNDDSADGDLGSPVLSGTLGFDFGDDGGGAVLFTDTGPVTLNGVTYSFTTATDGLSVVVDDGTQDVIQVTLADTTSGNYTLMLLVPLTHEGTSPGFEDDLNFSFNYIVTDSDSVLNNPATFATDTLDVLIDDDVPTTTDVAGMQAQDEEDQPVSVDITDHVSPGADGVDLANDVTFSSLTGAGTLSYDNGVFTYSPVPGETGMVSFNYTVFDGDNDSSTSQVVITLQGDSEPLISSQDVTVDEDGFPGANSDTLPVTPPEVDSTENASAQGVLTVNYGNDVPADLMAAFEFSSAAADIAALDSQGLLTLSGAVTWSVSADGHTLSGNDGLTDVITIVLTGASVNVTGAVEYNYTVTLSGPLVHETATLEDSLLLSNVTFNVSDSDVNTASGSFSVSFVDDVPTAADDSFDVTEAGSLPDADAAVSGNVITNTAGADDVGADGATVALSGDGVGTFGIVSLSANGDFTYVPFDSVDAGESESFTYILTDSDGDESVATLTFNFTGDRNTPEAVLSEGLLDDDGLGGNPNSTIDDLDANVGDLDGTASSEASFTGALSVNYGLDGAGTASFENLDAAVVIVGLESVSLAWNGGLQTLTATITGGARSGAVLFDVVLTAGVNPGDYSYALTQYENVLHADGPNEEATDVVLGLNYRTIDSDGSELDTNTLSITFDDDAPTATSETGSVAEGAVLTGQLDFIAGADDASVTEINDAVLIFGADGYSQSVDIGDGSIRVMADGTYDFTADSALVGLGSASASFTVTDGDGDEAVESISFDITDASTPSAGNAAAFVDDDGLGGNAASIAGDRDTDLTDSGAGLGDESLFVGTLGGSVGADGAGANGFAFDLSAATGTSGAMVGLETVVYSVSGNVLTATIVSGARANTDLFTVTITDAATGAYEVNLLDNVLHINGPNDENADIDDALAAVNYTITDADGSAVTGNTLSITFDDDAPTASLLMSQNVAEGDMVTGNLDFVAGADGGGVTSIAGETLIFAADGFSQSVDLGGGSIRVTAGGAYEFTADATVAGPGTVQAEFVVTDGDGDTASADLNFTVVDGNTPSAGESTAAVDDDGLSGNPNSSVNDLNANIGDLDGALSSEASFSGLLNLSYGGDGAGSVGFAAMNGLTATLGTELVTYAWDGVAGVLTATTDGALRPSVDLFTVTMTDTATGAYTVNLLTNVLHVDDGANDENVLDPEISLAFTVTDADGSNEDGTLLITFDDDAPSAVNNATVTTEGGAVQSGNLISDDFAGADGPLTVLSVTYNGTVYQPGDMVTTPNGTFSFSSDGSYSHTSGGSVAAGTIDSLSYTAADADGDEVTGELVLTFAGDVNVPVAGTAQASADEDDIALIGNNDTQNGDLVAPTLTGTLGFNYGLDGAGTVLFSDTPDVTIGGVTYSFTAAPDGLSVLVNDGTQNVIQVVLDDATSGSYTLTLLAPLSHAGTDPGFEDDLNFSINYTVTDSDSASGDPSGFVVGTLDVLIDDDIPVIGSLTSLDVVNAAGASDADSAAFDFGADGPGAITITPPDVDGISYVYVLDADGVGVTAFGQDTDGTNIFSFHVEADGSYEFTLITPEAAVSEVVSLANLAAGNTVGFVETGDFQLEFSSPSGDPLNVSQAGFAPDGQWFNLGESILLETYNETATLGDDTPDSTLDIEGIISSISFNVDIQGNFNNGIGNTTIAYEVTNTITGQVEIGTATLVIDSVAGTAIAVIDPSIEFNTVELSNPGGTLFRLSAPTISRTILPQNIDLEFGVSLTDGDGDVSSVQTVVVSIDAGGSGSSLGQSKALADFASDVGSQLFDDFQTSTEDDYSAQYLSARESGGFTQTATLLAGLAVMDEISHEFSPLNELTSLQGDFSLPDPAPALQIAVNYTESFETDGNTAFMAEPALNATDGQTAPSHSNFTEAGTLDLAALLGSADSSPLLQDMLNDEALFGILQGSSESISDGQSLVIFAQADAVTGEISEFTGEGTGVERSVTNELSAEGLLGIDTIDHLLGAAEQQHDNGHSETAFATQAIHMNDPGQGALQMVSFDGTDDLEMLQLAAMAIVN